MNKCLYHYTNPVEVDKWRLNHLQAKKKLREQEQNEQ